MFLHHSCLSLSVTKQSHYQTALENLSGEFIVGAYIFRWNCKILKEEKDKCGCHPDLSSMYFLADYYLMTASIHIISQVRFGGVLGRWYSVC